MISTQGTLTQSIKQRHNALKERLQSTHNNCKKGQVRVVLLITPCPYLDISNMISSISISLISNMAELILSRGKVQFLRRRSMYRNSGVDQWKWEIGGREGGGGGGGGTGLLQLLHLPSCWNLLHVTSHALHLTRYIS